MSKKLVKRTDKVVNKDFDSSILKTKNETLKLENEALKKEMNKLEKQLNKLILEKEKTEIKIRRSKREKKKVERYADVQGNYFKGKYHGWNDTYDRKFNGHDNSELHINKEYDKETSGYKKDKFVKNNSSVEESDYSPSELSESESEYEN